MDGGPYMPLAFPDGKTVVGWYRSFHDTQPTDEKLGLVDVITGKNTLFDGEGMNPIAYLEGHLIFGRKDGLLGVTPFDPERSRSVRNVLPFTDTPYNRSAGGMVADLSKSGDLVYVRNPKGSRLTFLNTQGHIIRSFEEERIFRQQRISPDGRQALMTQQSLDRNVYGTIWMKDLVSGELRRLINNPLANNPEWTPDGRNFSYRILLPAKSTPSTQIWLAPSDGSSTGKQLVEIPGIPVRTVFSPDSHYAVVATLDPKTQLDLYLMNLKDDKSLGPLASSTANEAMPEVSPDSRWLAYVSDESDRNEVYVQPFPKGAGRIQISTGGGSEPHWSKDGQFLFYRDGFQLIRATLKKETGITVVQREALFSDTLLPGFDLNPDNNIMVLRPGISDPEVILVTNWIAGLKKADEM